jgi:transcriptional regulator with PAS, ATPase and Fis domain
MPRPPSPARSLLKLLDQAAQPVYALDGQRRVVYANPALGEWLGQEPENLVGLRCDYHAGGGEKASSEVGAALCPPPEAFGGDCRAGQVARPAGEQRTHEQRPARFLWLPGPAPEQGVLLIVVFAPESAPAASADGQFSPQQLHALLQRLRGQMGRRYHIGQLIGESDAIRRVREQVRLAAASATRVLIVGPPGSGREHIARTIHYSQPPAGIGPLVPIDCSLVDAEELQARLTDLLKRRDQSAASGPAAALLLDVDRLRADAQQELAGFLLLPGIELHTLATSRTALQRLATRGKFRRDLAYALSTLTIKIPALHARREDIPLLAQHFLEETNAAGGRQLSGFTPAAMELLTAHPWPGHVAELAESVREASSRAAGPQLLPADLPDRVHLAMHALEHPPRGEEAIRLDDLLTEIERELLQRALAKARGNKSKAAQLLGINRPRLLRRLVQLGLAAPPPPEEPVVFEPVPDESDAS